MGESVAWSCIKGTFQQKPWLGLWAVKSNKTKKCASFVEQHDRGFGCCLEPWKSPTGDHRARLGQLGPNRMPNSSDSTAGHTMVAFEMTTETRLALTNRRHANKHHRHIVLQQPLLRWYHTPSTSLDTVGLQTFSECGHLLRHTNSKKRSSEFWTQISSFWNVYNCL